MTGFVDGRHPRKTLAQRRGRSPLEDNSTNPVAEGYGLTTVSSHLKGIGPAGRRIPLALIADKKAVVDHDLLAGRADAGTVNYEYSVLLVTDEGPSNHRE